MSTVKTANIAESSGRTSKAFSVCGVIQEENQIVQGMETASYSLNMWETGFSDAADRGVYEKGIYGCNGRVSIDLFLVRHSK